MKKDIEQLWWFRDSKNILFAFGGIFFVVCFFTIILNASGVTHFDMYSKDGETNFSHLWYPYIFAPIFEELGFRWIPFMALMAIVNKDQKTFDRVKWYWAFIWAAGFGYLHYGYFSVFIQGVLGFGIWYVYYKNRYSYVSGVILHFLWNFTLGTLLPITGY